MSKAGFTEEFKEEAVRQVIERGYSVPDVANRLENGLDLQSSINQTSQHIAE